MRLARTMVALVGALSILSTGRAEADMAESAIQDGGMAVEHQSDLPPEPPEQEPPPSRMDPGMQHRKERQLDPRGSVTPPNRDPSMSTNPDVAAPEDRPPERRSGGRGEQREGTP